MAGKKKPAVLLGAARNKPHKPPDLREGYGVTWDKLSRDVCRYRFPVVARWDAVVGGGDIKRCPLLFPNPTQ